MLSQIKRLNNPSKATIKKEAYWRTPAAKLLPKYDQHNYMQVAAAT